MTVRGGGARGASFGLTSHGEDVGAQLSQLFSEIGESLQGVSESLSAVQASMPDPAEEFVGQDEERTTRVVIKGTLRIVSVELEAAALETDDADGAEPPSGEARRDDGLVVTGVAMRIQQAYRAAVESAFSEEAVEKRTRRRAVQTSSPPRASGIPTRQQARIEPGAWPSEAELAEFERLQRQTQEAFTTPAGRADIHGEDEGRHVAVTVGPDGSLISIAMDERWLDGVSASLVSSTVMEALHGAYATIAEQGAA